MPNDSQSNPKETDEARLDFKNAGIGHNTVQTGILFRPPADPTPEDEEGIKPLRDAAKQSYN